MKPVKITGRYERLKTEPKYWDAILKGEKTFEVRLNDRNYEVGLNLFLHRGVEEYELHDNENLLVVQVRYVLEGGQFGIELGYVVMSIELLLAMVDGVITFRKT